MRTRAAGCGNEIMFAWNRIVRARARSEFIPLKFSSISRVLFSSAAAISIIPSQSNWLAVRYEHEIGGLTPTRTCTHYTHTYTHTYTRSHSHAHTHARAASVQLRFARVSLVSAAAASVVAPALPIIFTAFACSAGSGYDASRRSYARARARCGHPDAHPRSSSVSVVLVLNAFAKAVAPESPHSLSGARCRARNNELGCHCTQAIART